MLELIFTIGIPGSGKSAWVSSLKTKYYIVCPDEIRASMGNISDQSLNNTVWLIAKEKIKTAFSLGHNVILDATNVNTKYRRNFIETFPPDGIQVSEYFNKICTLKAKLFDVDPEIAISRIKNDIASGRCRSNVPEDIVYRMYGEFLYTKKVISSEEFIIIE